MPFIAIALIVAAALGGGVSVAANHALPGDTLWGFKTSVNEQVAGAFKLGDEASANWNIEVAAARLEEARKLAAEGRLSADAQADISTNFDTHAQAVATLVHKLQAAGDTAAAADIAARFKAAVAANSAGLEQARAEVTANGSAEAKSVIDSLLIDVRGTLDAATSLSAGASADTSTSASTNASSTDGNAGAGANVKVKVDADGSADINL